ncbi:2,3-diaminopropionate biosynthesis protein SbnB [Paenibacillus sedimenti]|uniref:2,3-diaminopropionate biosynthesis protein SbnB n=1 Tax=Paenibacillus sedimenti TaxID=2770274 RepID=A0A926KUH3_9BACL|nr:2,3-diaminopropionate biosynthesis protein SbnB [Paenibacillus sedimenti]MBD0383538.1 2,3-diaminopropionate biosynthesis protein SbnB [Paenibacillus sedimenti]
MTVTALQPSTGTLLYLSRQHIAEAGGESPALYAEVIEEALKLHAQGQYVQPLKPYLRVPGEGGEPGHIADRIIAMPSYVGGDMKVSGLKWIGSKHDNPGTRGLERASGIIVLNDPASNYPIALMEAALISSMRTAAVTAVGVKYLAKRTFASVTVIGCGLIAERQLQAVCELFPQVTVVHLYDTRPQAASRLAERIAAAYQQVSCRVEDSAEQAVRCGDVVIPCTVADQPYISYSWLRPGAFVSNISIMDLHKDVFLQADKVVVDDWEQSNREKKIIHQLVQEGLFSKDALHAELGEIAAGLKPGRERDDEIIVLNPMGMALEDIACAYRIYERAVGQGIGIPLPLYE